MRKIGYARVSTADQNLAAQVAELKAAGCEPVFSDTASGVKAARPGLDQCLKSLMSGDVLIVKEISRLGRSLPHLVEVVADLRSLDIQFKSLSEGTIDTTTAAGNLVFNVFCALADFERTLLKERTKAGLEAAKSAGRVGGRKPVSEDPKVRQQVELAHMMKNNGKDVKQIQQALGISRTTVYRWLKIDLDEKTPDAEVAA